MTVAFKVESYSLCKIVEQKKNRGIFLSMVIKKRQNARPVLPLFGLHQEKSSLYNLYTYACGGLLCVNSRSEVITADYVHPVQVLKGGFRWHNEEVWIEKYLIP